MPFYQCRYGADVEEDVKLAIICIKHYFILRCPPIHQPRQGKVPLAQVREKLIELDKRWIPWPDKLVSATIPLRHSNLLHYVHLTKSPLLGNLFYVRGGGFCFKTPHAHARLVADIGRRCQLDIYIPDYRLAPEYPFPAPCDDVMEAYLRLIDLKGANNLVLMGDSAEVI